MMAKKYFQKAMSVGLSLALCATMAAPAFAASFTELQEVINNGTSLENRITYDNGKVTLNEDVTNNGNEDCITISSGTNVILDLAGYTIDYSAKTGGSTIWVNGGTLTLEDSGRTDEAGEHISGKVTGGKSSGVYVEGGGSLTMKGGTITGNITNGNGGGVVVKGSNSKFEMTGGKISGNDITGSKGNGYGGGVYVVNGGSFTMEGGEISGNTAKSSGGGVAVEGSGSKFEMTGGTITDNTAKNSNGNGSGGGGGVWVKGGATFEMSGESSAITNNHINGNNGGGGGVAVHQGNFTMNGGEISGNTAGKGDGVQVHASNTQSGSFTITNGTIKGEVTVLGEGNNPTVDIQGGNFSQLDEKYLNNGKGLVRNEDGTYGVKEKGEDGHIWSEWETKTPARIGVAGTEERHCLVEGCSVEHQTRSIPALPEPITVEIDEPAVPLAAGPVTQAEFIDYLWRHEGEPEAEAAGDHEYASAIGWAQSIGIVEADAFQADELVTVALVRDILTRFAAYADMAMPELTTLTGEDDEAVLNCDEILAEFFGEGQAE